MPLLFHGLVGKDEREGNSPSWFNELEAKQVCVGRAPSAAVYGMRQAASPAFVARRGVALAVWPW